MRDPIHNHLELYTSATLSPREMVEFDEHLQKCGLCQSEAPGALAAAAALIPDSPAPPGTWTRISAALDSA